MDVFNGENCSFCVSKSLDPLSHHVLTCKFNVVSRHNRLHDTLFEVCRQAGIGGQMEVGRGLGHDAQGMQLADVLVFNCV